MEFTSSDLREKQVDKKEKHVPIVAQSAKFITAAKKEMDKEREK